MRLTDRRYNFFQYSKFLETGAIKMQLGNFSISLVVQAAYVSQLDYLTASGQSPNAFGLENEMGFMFYDEERELIWITEGPFLSRFNQVY